jgi:hypothetical protein
VRAKEWRTAIVGISDSYVCTLIAGHHKERVEFLFNVSNHVFTAPHPSCRQITNMRNVFMRAETVGLSNMRNLTV